MVNLNKMYGLVKAKNNWRSREGNFVQIKLNRKSMYAAAKSISEILLFENASSSNAFHSWSF